MTSVLGLVGGSGLYGLDVFDSFEWVDVQSPWGSPSDQVLTGEIDGLKVCFLPRHGRGHVQTPSSINYRANIDCLKRLGVTDLVSISACGSFREELSPGTFVLVSQFIDRTVGRESSFFGAGCVAHVSMAVPVSPYLQSTVADCLRACEIRHHVGGTYLCIEGPQFSSIAESRLYQSIGVDVIGMTNATEAKLAREAEICYSTVAMVTDYDSWHPDHGTVDITSIMSVLKNNGEQAQALVRELVRIFPRQHRSCPVGSDRALDYAIMTHLEQRDPELLKKLDAVAGRVLSV